MREFIQARFISPPLLFVFSIFLANPIKFKCLFLEYLSRDVFSVVFSTVFIFSIGFFISSLATAFYINPFNKRAVLDFSDEEILNMANSISGLSVKNLSNEEKNSLNELMTWISMSDDSYKFIREQLQKSWHAFNASANCWLSVVLSFLFVCIAGWDSANYWGWFLFFALTALTINTQNSYENLKNLENLWLRIFRNLQKAR